MGERRSLRDILPEETQRDPWVAKFLNDVEPLTGDVSAKASADPSDPDALMDAMRQTGVMKEPVNPSWRDIGESARDAFNLEGDSPLSLFGSAVSAPGRAGASILEGIHQKMRPFDKAGIETKELIAPDITRATAGTASKLLRGHRPATKVRPDGTRVAGSINLDTLAKEGDEFGRLLGITAEEQKNMLRGVKTLDDLHADASKWMSPRFADAAMTLDDFDAGKVGALLTAHKKSARGVLEAAEAYAKDPTSEAALARFYKNIREHGHLAELRSKTASEIGRALRIHQRDFLDKTVDKFALDDLLKSGNLEDFRRVAPRILDDVQSIKDPATASQYLEKAANPKFWDKLHWVWLNSILSGVETLQVNFASNAAYGAAMHINRRIQGAIGSAVKPISKGLKKARLTKSEYKGFTSRDVSAEMGDFSNTMKEAVRSWFRAWNDGADDIFTRVETMHQRPIKGLKGKIAGAPTGWLGADDNFWKTIHLRMSLRRQASQQAGKLKGAERHKFIEEFVAKPTDDALRKAIDEARELTFTTPAGPIAQKVNKLRSVPGVRYLLPFLRTPTNIFKQAIYSSPAALMTPTFWGKVAGKAATGETRIDALTRVATSSGVLWSITDAVNNGLITGSGPPDRGQYAVWRENHEPNAVKIGDRWVSYARYEPFATIIGMYADVVSHHNALTEKGLQVGNAEYWEDMLGATVKFMNKNMTDKTFFQGIKNLVNLINPPYSFEHSATKAVGDPLLGFIPNALSQASRAYSTYYKDTEGSDENKLVRLYEGFINSAKERLGLFGLDEDLPDRRSVTGKKMKRPEYGVPYPAAGPHVPLSLFTKGKKVGEDEVASAFEGSEVSLDYPSREIRMRDAKVRLTPKQYNDLLKFRGEYLRSMVGARFDSRYMRKKYLQRVKARASRAARRRLLAEYPELLDSLMQKQFEQMNK